MCFRMENRIIRNSIIFLTYSVILFLIIYTFYKSWNEPYLWYDEAVQFYDSRGIDYDNFNIEPNINNIHFKNSRFNMDPGGYTLFMHYWSRYSINPFFLRIPNFIFFLITILVIGKLFLTTIKDQLKVSISILCILLLYDGMIVNRAVEIRAYMIEILVSVICLYLIYEPKRIIVKGNLVLKSVLVIFVFSAMWARYSTVVFILLSWFYFAILHLGLFSKKSLIGFLAIFTNVFLIYFFMLYYQNPLGLAMDYLNYLDSFEGIVALLDGDIYYVVGLFFLLILIVNKTKQKENRIESFFEKFQVELKMSKSYILIGFVLILNFAFIFLSLLHKYPFDPSNPRCFFIVLLTLVTILILVMQLDILNQRFLTLGAIFVMIYGIQNRGFFHRGYENYYFKQQLGLLDSLTSQESDVFITYWPGLSIKYAVDQDSVNFNRKKFHFQEQPILVHKETAEYFNIKDKLNVPLPRFRSGDFHLVHKYGDSAYLDTITKIDKLLIRDFPMFNQKLFKIL